MLMSRTSRSQASSRSLSRTSFPVAASPTVVTPGTSSRNCRRPARNTAWSSAISTFAIVVQPPSDAARRARVAVELVVKGLEAATQRIGGLALVAGKVLERRLDDGALDVAEPRADRNLQRGCAHRRGFAAGH